MADEIVRVRGVAYNLYFGACHGSGNQRSAFPVMLLVCTTALFNSFDRYRISEIPAFGIAAILTKNPEWMHNRITGNVLSHFLDRIDRIFRDVFRLNTRVRDLVHEGTVGPVLQQTTYQVRQQFAMSSDRRINPAGYATFFHYLAVQGFTHTVQTLKLIVGFTS